MFQGVAGGDDNTKVRLHTIPEKSKETVRNLQRNTKSFVRIYKSLNRIK